MKCNKLVRDNIPEIIELSGSIPVTYIADNNEYWKRLKAKLLEETNEVLEDTNVDEELADVLEVIHAILDFKGMNFEELEKLRLKKKEKKGGFSKKIILKEIKE